MNRVEATRLAQAIKANLPDSMRERLKNIDIIPKLHDGMCTIRLYMFNKVAEEPEAFIFPSKEIHCGDRSEV